MTDQVTVKVHLSGLNAVTWSSSRVLLLRYPAQRFDSLLILHIGWSRHVVLHLRNLRQHLKWCCRELKKKKWNCIILKYINIMKYDEHCFKHCSTLQYLYCIIGWMAMLTECLSFFHVYCLWLNCLIVKTIIFIFALTLYNLSKKKPQARLQC